MEKGKKTKKKILSFLARSATVSFQNLPFSPGREKRSENPNNKVKGSSGPIISMIPEAARIKSKSGRSFGAQEPTSPKISCMGQVKSKNNNTSKHKHPSSSSTSIVANLICGSKPPHHPHHHHHHHHHPPELPLDRAPALSQIRRFASSRGALQDFEWDREQQDQPIIPHSAPMTIIPREPRKEINLWKRRTMDPPKPLKLNSLR